MIIITENRREKSFNNFWSIFNIEIDLEIRFPSVLNIDICTRYLTSQIICSWGNKVSRKSLCKYWLKFIYILSLIIINTSFIICIACIHQPSIEIYIETAVIRTFVVHMRMASDSQESMDLFQVSENYHHVQIMTNIFLFCEHIHISIIVDKYYMFFVLFIINIIMRTYHQY